jgi:hypothetical protein
VKTGRPYIGITTLETGTASAFKVNTFLSYRPKFSPYVVPRILFVESNALVKPLGMKAYRGV